MITLFDVPSTDQSVYYLGQVFGWVGGVLPVEKASIILGTMFRVFNSVVLSVAALIILYVSVVGIMKTAAEGEFLGRGWSTLWTPLRMVIGIAALVPTQSGYSAIQIVMMWVVLQGIGAADLVWKTVLQYTSVMGSPYSTVTVPGVSENNDIPNLFQMAVCQRTAHSKDDFTPKQGSNEGRYYCSTVSSQTPGFCQWDSELTDLSGPQSTLDSGSNQWTFKFGPNSECGTFTFCDPTSSCANATSASATMQDAITCNGCKNSVQNLQAITTAFDQAAKRFVEVDSQYRRFYAGTIPTPEFVKSYCKQKGLTDEKSCCVPRLQPSTDITKLGQMEPVPGTEKCGITFSPNDGTNLQTPDPTTVSELYWPFGIQPFTGENFIQAAIDRYVTGLTDAANESIQNRITKAEFGSSDKDQLLKEASDQGWVFAGAYYFWLAKTNKDNTNAATPTFSTNANISLKPYRTNGSAAENVTSLSSTASASSMTASIPPELSGLNKLSNGMDSAGKSIMRSMMNNLTGGEAAKDNPELATDPLVKLQYLGYVLLIVAQVLFALIIAVSVVITLVGYLSPFALGTGATNPIGATFSTLAVIFAPFFVLILGGLFTFGALLSIYTPLIPYIVFTMGVLGWFILVIEAMIAAPLVAIGILLPGGQSEILGKAEGALMYAFGLFLRPSLMIFGMMAAMLLSVVMVTMINVGFLGVVGSINKAPGFVEMFLFMGAYVGLLLAVLNKCFALIHIIPDRVLRWIGGHPEETGPGEGLQGAKGGVEAVGAQEQKMGGEAYGRGSEGAAGGKKAAQKRGKAKEKEAKKALKLKAKQDAGNKGGDKGGGEGGEEGGETEE